MHASRAGAPRWRSDCIAAWRTSGSLSPVTGTRAGASVLAIELLEGKERDDAGVEIAAAHGGAAQRRRHCRPTAAGVAATEDLLLRFSTEHGAGRSEGGEERIVGGVGEIGEWRDWH